MGRFRKKGRGGRWIGLLGLAALLVMLTFLAARMRPALRPALTALKPRPASLQGLRASLDSMSSSGWRARFLAEPDSGPAQWRLIVPASCPLVSANLAIHRLSAEHGISVVSASEDRRRGSLEILLSEKGRKKARLLVSKGTPNEADGQGRPMLALVAYEVKGDWAAQSRRLSARRAVMTLAAGTRVGGASGMEILALAPLEPKGYPRQNPGPNTVLIDDAPSARRSKLHRALEANGGAGALCIQHGSRAVEDQSVMADVAGFCAERGLALVEPVPTPRSLARASCRKLGVRYFTPDFYIGRSSTPQQARTLLKKAEAEAEKRGRAMVLLPAADEALKAVGDVFPPDGKRSVELVPLSRLKTQ